MTSGRHRARQPQSQKLTDKEILELKNYLPEWTAAKRSEKRGIFTAIARAARLFAPKVDQKQWKKRKQVYKTWLFNNKKKKERKDTIKYSLTPRMVVYQQKREEVLKRIEDESGVKPGDPGMFKHYQAAVKRVMAELDDDELEKAKETAEEWSNNCPPPEIQAQVARKKGPAYMEHFRTRCGGNNEKGEVLFGMHDDNEALGDGDSFMKTKDWEDIEPVWQEYAQEQFGAGARDGGRQVKGGRKRIRKPAFELEMDGEGEEGHSEGLSYIALSDMFRKDKAVVPWSAIVQSQDDFVARTYLLADVDLKEPSKLQNWDTTALLHFWHARQETGEGPTFLFKACKNKDGDMVPSVISGKSPSPQTSIVRKQQRVTIRGPRDSSTEAESDKESATNHTEDDVDDDLADGRHPLMKPRTGGPTPKGTAVPRAIPKPRRAKPAKKGALLTSRMGDLLAGLTEDATREVREDVEMEESITPPAQKRGRGKKVTVEPSTRTTRSKLQMPVDSTPRVTRARGRT
ncbi:uncharacterized protein HD556DRAFT_1450032 [Suillus plorans]|uniref:Uncharacterized protein n=1 Tax=Suillus plorans TaxID=116603 RepID=A0A9P7ADP1_9AGAM|nr:uncharacterized protein HD556DRAFT_1450032 [Suillus plorans]KAG1786175.1 hypothetical protein HD556DRAFT_1450032 [Suillus plorans]